MSESDKFRGRIISFSIQSLDQWRKASFPVFAKPCIRLNAPQPLRLGETLAVALRLPDDSVQRIRARVVWINNLIGGGREAGIMLDKEPDLGALEAGDAKRERRLS